MTVVSFNITKMLAEKKKLAKGKIDIKNNVTIKNVSESKLAIDPKRVALKFDFEYVAKYEPELGVIEISGETIFLAEKQVAVETIKIWNKDKKISGDFVNSLMNHILAKCNVQAVILSKDINLPAPIPLPRIK